MNQGNDPNHSSDSVELQSSSQNPEVNMIEMLWLVREWYPQNSMQFMTKAVLQAVKLKGLQWTAPRKHCRNFCGK